MFCPPRRIFRLEVWPLNSSLVDRKRLLTLCFCDVGLTGSQISMRNSGKFLFIFHRPHSTDSATHRKMTLSLADRCSKTQKIRILPMAGRDPECQRTEMIKVSCLGFTLEQLCTLRTDCPNRLLFSVRRLLLDFSSLLQ